MLEKKIYQERFKNSKQRKELWNTLTKHFFQKFIKQTDTVLDIPCGYGEFINALLCRKKYAVDINPDSKKHLAKNVTFLHCSSTNIPLAKSIDKIFISNFFEHLTKKDILLTIKQCKKILKKNGKVLVLQPNIRFCIKDYWMFFDHITPIDDRALEEVFTACGFTIEYKIERFLPFTTQSRLPKHPFFVYLYLKMPFLWRFFGQQSFLILH